MISRLSISNFALLEQIEIDFERGLSLFTGETGAGKSILIDAICGVLGARMSQNDVRAGAAKSIIEVVFDASAVTDQAKKLLERWEIDSIESDLILRREIQSSGKTRALINNCSVTIQQLKALAPHLVDVFGQSEHQSLLDEQSQQALYDESLGIETALQELRTIDGEIAMLQQEWRTLKEREQQRQRNIDMLQFQIREIEEATIAENEEEELLSKKVLLQNSEKIHSICDALLQDLLESEERNLSSLLDSAGRQIEELARFKEPLDAFAIRVREWKQDLVEIVREVDVLRRSLNFDEGDLHGLESRLDVLHRLKRKYGPSISEVLQHLARSKEELNVTLHAEEREEELVQQTKKAAERYTVLASEITVSRQSSKERFEKKVEKELHQVAMEKCRFRVNMGSKQTSEEEFMTATFPASGWESVHFEIEPNPGEGFHDLNRIASGGELSRLMLALKVVTQSRGTARCLIFDEIDAGIGGRVAYQIGERLKRLCQHSQVLCVTHLPQVAAFGDHHYQVRKKVKSDRTITVVERLQDPARIQELARMLSGSEVTETALQHARELRDQVQMGTR